jgi:quinol monooxygenase YgiN
MLRRAIWALAAVVCLGAPAGVRAQGDYLDVLIVKVKPEKAADFNAIAKKMADANRRNNGDRWLAMEAVYGESNTFTFVSTRKDYADVDTGNEAFIAALRKAYGKEASEKMLHDWDNCLVSSRSELRRRRWDLSRKAPTDPAAYAKLVGESRLLRTTAVHVRPGQVAEFETLMKDAKEASEKSASTQTVLVSQVIEGGNGTVFYVTSLRSSMGGFDNSPTALQVMGEEGYKKFLKISAESVEGTESALYHFSAELSNPPEDVAQVASDFWQPKQIVATAAPKTKAAAAGAKEVKAPADKPQQ